MTADLIVRPLDLDTLTLGEGAHPDADGMCLMEAVAYIAGEDWSDSPECASPVIAAFGRAWNDALDDEDRQMLVPYAPRIVGTRSTPEVEEARAWLAADWLIRVHTPAWLRLAGLDVHADALSDAAPIDGRDALDAVRPALDAAGDAARAAARDTALDAAGDAARAAAGDAARDAAWDAARDAAWDAAGDAARDAARDAAWDAARAAAGDAAWVAALAAALDIAWAAACAVAAGSALRPTVEALQVSALDLLDRMIDCEVAS